MVVKIKASNIIVWIHLREILHVTMLNIFVHLITFYGGEDKDERTI